MAKLALLAALSGCALAQEGWYTSDVGASCTEECAKHAGLKCGAKSIAEMAKISSKAAFEAMNPGESCSSWGTDPWPGTPFKIMPGSPSANGQCEYRRENDNVDCDTNGRAQNNGYKYVRFCYCELVPHVCCKAMTATCLACAAGVTEEQFCANPKNAGTVVGCGPLQCSHVHCKHEKHRCEQRATNHYGQEWTVQGWRAKAFDQHMPQHPNHFWAGVNQHSTCTGLVHESVRVYHDAKQESRCSKHMRCATDSSTGKCKCHALDNFQVADADTSRPVVLAVECADKRHSACSLFGSRSGKVFRAVMSGQPQVGKEFSIHVDGYTGGAPPLYGTSRNYLEYQFSKVATVAALKVEQAVKGCTRIAAWVNGQRVRDAVPDMPSFAEGSETVFVIPPPLRSGTVFRFACTQSVDAHEFAIYRARPVFQDFDLNVVHHCVGKNGKGVGGCKLPFHKCAEGWFGETCKRNTAAEKAACEGTGGTIVCTNGMGRRHQYDGGITGTCDCSCPHDTIRRSPTTWTGANGPQCVPQNNILRISCEESNAGVSACSKFGNNSPQLRTAVFGDDPQCPRYTCAQGYPQNKGIGEQAFSLHSSGYAGHAPAQTSVTFQFFDPMTIAGTAIEQHSYGCTRVEGFMDGVSMGTADARAFGLTRGNVGFFTEGEEARFVFAKPATGREFEVRCVQTSYCCAFATYRVRPTLV